MVNYTMCDTCIHKAVCKYVDTPKVKCKQFMTELKEFKEFEVNQTFDVIFKCKKYEKRNGTIR